MSLRFNTKHLNVASERVELKTNGATTELLLLALLLAIVLLTLRPSWNAPVPPMDEGMDLVYPEQLLHGRVPNRDFFFIYGPLSVWLVAGAYLLCGVHLVVERSVGALYMLLTVFGMYAWCRPCGRPIALFSSLATGAAIFGRPMEADASLASAAALVWTMCYLRGASSANTDRRRRILFGLAGLTGAVVVSLRPELLVIVLVLCVIWLPAASTPERHRCFLVFALGLVPLLIHIAVAGPAAVFDNIVIEEMFRGRAGRALPMPSLLGPGGWLLDALLLSTALSLAVGVLQLRAGTHPMRARAVLSAGAVSALLLPEAMQRADVWHFLNAGCLTVGFLAPAACALFALRSTPAPRMLALAISAVILIPTMYRSALRPWALQLRAGLGLHQRATYEVWHDGRRCIVFNVSQMHDLSQLMTVLEPYDKTGVRLFVGPEDLTRTVYNDTVLYYLLPRMTPATYFLQMDPGISNRPGGRLAADLASADVVVLYDQPWNEPNASRLAGSTEPIRVLEQHFQAQWQVGHFWVFTRRTAPSSLS